jgi:AraC-like DNA-binding protein
VGLYYNLTDGEASVVNNNIVCNVGRWKYNLAVIDSTLETDYQVKAGTGTYALCIFIKKNMIASFAKKNNVFFTDLNKITDPAKNTVIRFDRMSNESFHLLDDLRKLKVGGPIFDLHLTATVHMLISNYLKKLSLNRIVIQTVNETDLKNIIEMQMLLIENIEKHFPSITYMASHANMSESKFKDLFKKITGSTPNSFFMDNKLNLAKELLETKQLSISQISDRLSFTNNSYFTSKFKEHFGVSPKAFIQQL